MQSKVDINPKARRCWCVTWEITEENIQLIYDTSLFGFLKFVWKIIEEKEEINSWLLYPAFWVKGETISPRGTFFFFYNR